MMKDKHNNQTEEKESTNPDMEKDKEPVILCAISKIAGPGETVVRLVED